MNLNDDRLNARLTEAEIQGLTNVEIARFLYAKAQSHEALGLGMLEEHYLKGESHLGWAQIYRKAADIVICLHVPSTS
jgi:hypothetical protein